MMFVKVFFTFFLIFRAFFSLVLVFLSVFSTFSQKIHHTFVVVFIPIGMLTAGSDGAFLLANQGPDFPSTMQYA
ncbi:hypothetical protein [Lacrimispora sp. 210928-DFI.3.58]|uniref:hypothetical protein n=1 Tax=Lacrimispora sp. 210928-DFI.3.58 TaxID=2883214 RepID=UPI0015B5A6A3|nr:hypothetical protein [Lacrimispora sp. 210928-DFI.3.58]MCB7318906.1 hypothetical protein [Lacrimispora sp. 210928-DFI.3.58]